MCVVVDKTIEPQQKVVGYKIFKYFYSKQGKDMFKKCLLPLTANLDGLLLKY